MIGILVLESCIIEAPAQHTYYEKYISDNIVLRIVNRKSSQISFKLSKNKNSFESSNESGSTKRLFTKGTIEPHTFSEVVFPDLFPDTGRYTFSEIVFPDFPDYMSFIDTLFLEVQGLDGYSDTIEWTLDDISNFQVVSLKLNPNKEKILRKVLDTIYDGENQKTAYEERKLGDTITYRYIINP